MTTWLFIFAGISALGDLMGIIREVRKQLSKPDEGDPWYARSVSLTAKKIVEFYLLGILALILSLFGMHNYMAERQLPTVEIKESPVTEFGRNGSTMYAIVNTRTLAGLSNQYVLVLACLVSDPTTDSMHDKRLEKSSLFEIQGDSLRIELNPSTEFLSRAEQTKPSPDNKFVQITVHRVDLYLIAWPKHVSLDKLTVLSDVKEIGGNIVGTGGFMRTPP